MPKYVAIGYGDQAGYKKNAGRSALGPSCTRRLQWGKDGVSAKSIAFRTRCSSRPEDGQGPEIWCDRTLNDRDLIGDANEERPLN